MSLRLLLIGVSECFSKTVKMPITLGGYMLFKMAVAFLHLRAIAGWFDSVLSSYLRLP